MSLRPLKHFGSGAFKELLTSEEDYLAYRAGVHLGKMSPNDLSALSTNSAATLIGRYENSYYNNDASTVPLEEAHTRTFEVIHTSDSGASTHTSVFDSLYTPLPSTIFVGDVLDIVVIGNVLHTGTGFNEIEYQVSLSGTAERTQSSFAEPTATNTTQTEVTWEDFDNASLNSLYRATFRIQPTQEGLFDVIVSAAATDLNNPVQISNDSIYLGTVRVEPRQRPADTTDVYELYQNDSNVASIITESSLKRNPFFWDKDLDPAGLREVNDFELDLICTRLLSSIFENDYPGTFRLASVSPGTNWSIFLENVFVDTRSDGSELKYSIWIKQEAEAIPSTVRPLAPFRLNGVFAGIKELTDPEMEFTFGERMKSLIMSTKIGTYQLRSSEQGPPTEAGTWLAKGSAVNTVREYEEDQNYLGLALFEINYTEPYVADYTAEYEGNYSPTYEQTYVGDYVGTYQGSDILETYTAEYEGVDILLTYSGDYEGSTYTSESEVVYTSESEIPYTGDFDATYIGDYTAEFSADYTGDFSDIYVGDYTAETLDIYTSESTADYIKEFTAEYVGDYTGLYIGDYTKEFSADYIGDYAGPSAYVTYIGDYTLEFTADYTGDFSVDYVGDYVKEFSATYVGDFSADYAGVTYTKEFSATYEGNSSAVYTGDFLADYTAEYVKEFSATYTSESAIDYLGDFTATYTGDYTGNFSADYTSESTINYTGDFSDTYIGAYLAEYILDFTATYEGTYQSTSVGNFSADYVSESRDYIDEVNYVGSGVVPGASVYLELLGDTTYYYQFYGTLSGSGTGADWPLALGSRIAGTSYYRGSSQGGGFYDVWYSSTGTITYTGDVTYTNETPITYTSESQIIYNGEYIGDYTSESIAATAYVVNYQGDYVGDSQIVYTGDFSATYTSESSAVYQGEYVSESGIVYTGDFSADYTSESTATYVQPYTSESTIDYTGDFSADYTSESSIDYIADYTGDSTTDYTSESSINYQGDYTSESSAVYTSESSAVYEGDYAGLPEENYLGTYTHLTYVAPPGWTYVFVFANPGYDWYVYENVGGTNLLRKSGFRLENAPLSNKTGFNFGFVSGSTYSGFIYAAAPGGSSGSCTTLSSGAVEIDIDYIGDYAGPVFINYEGTYTSESTIDYITDAETNYEGNYTSESEITYVGDFSANYEKEGEIVYQGDYTGDSEIDYTSESEITYQGDYVSESNAEYIGKFSENYTGDFSADYISTYIGDYTSEYTRTVSISYIGDYTPNYDGLTYEGDYTAEYVGGDIIETYTADYEGATYTQDYNNQYAVYDTDVGPYLDEGQRLSTPVKLETYTLYVRTTAQELIFAPLGADAMILSDGLTLIVR